MNIQAMLSELNERGFSDRAISDGLAGLGVKAGQSTIWRLRSGEQPDTSYSIGKAIERFHSKTQKMSRAA